MKYINLGHGDRIKRRDDMNWELERLRPAGTVEAFGRTHEVADKWKPMGKYFQRLDTAVSAAYELALRDGDEAVDLGDALALAEGIAASMRGAADGH